MAQRSLTHLRVFAGEGTPFEGGRGPRWEDFSDGTDRTILVVEADEAVPWTKPDELPYAPDKPLPALGGGTIGSFLVMMADGRVLSIPAVIDEELLRRAITRNDKQPLDLARLETDKPSPAPPGPKPGQDGNPSRTGRPGDLGAGQAVPSRPGDRILLSGRVLDPAGKPHAGAAVSFIRPVPDVWVPHPGPPRRPDSSTTSGSDGRFRFLVDRTQWEDVGQQARTSFPRRGPGYPFVAAVAPGYGPGWVPLARPEDGADVTLRLAKDDVPIEGRILDMEGRPVPGATVTADEILATPGEDLTPVIRSGGRGDVPVKFLAAGIVGLPQTLTTDRDGRFRLAGIGRERAVSLRISGPTIQTTDIHVMTRLDKAFMIRYERPKLPIADSPSIGAGPMVYGARFEHTVGPTKPIEGVVPRPSDGPSPPWRRDHGRLRIRAGR